MIISAYLAGNQPGSPGQIAGRVNQIGAEVENTDSNYDREKLQEPQEPQERLAELVGGAAVIKAGAGTEVGRRERKHRVEDAVRNAKAAVEEGVVPGGAWPEAVIAGKAGEGEGTGRPRRR